MARCFFCHIFRNRKHLDLLSLKGFFSILQKASRIIRIKNGFQIIENDFETTLVLVLVKNGKNSITAFSTEHE